MILLIIMTGLVYLLANGFTYHIGTTNVKCCSEPLYDVLHDILPDWSKWVWIRDIVLLALWIPFIVFVTNKLDFLGKFINIYLWIILFKAILIFFTFIPPSNKDCHQKRYLNHCYHNAVSGHAAMAAILILLYKTSFNTSSLISYMLIMAYSILILITRAHYTKDILEALILVGCLMKI